MTLFLRNNKNQTILDVELYEKEDYIELRSVVCIKPYSKFLLENLEKSEEIIEIFNQLSELRGWLWEVHFMGRQNKREEFDIVLNKLRNILKEVSNILDLYYVED